MNQVYSILVVEDNLEHQKVIQSIFDQTEISVDFVSSGSEAENFMVAIQYNLFIINLVTTDMNGLELLEKSRIKFPEIPILMISEYGNERDTVEAIKLGADNYISKSIGFQQRLHDEVIRLLQKSRFEDKISDAEAFYKQIFDSANDFMFTLDLDGCFTSFNKKCIEVFGNKATNAIGKSFVETIKNNETREIAQRYFTSLMIDSSNKSYVDLELLNKDDNPFTMEINASMMMKNGNVFGLLCVGRDVSEYLKINEQKKMLQLHLMDKHRLTSMGKMVQGIAHNINTPLSTIMGYAELLELQHPNGKGIKEIQNECLSISELIRVMVNHGINQEQELKEYCDINRIIEQEFRFFEGNTLYKFEIEKKFDLDENIPKIFCVYQHLSQALDVFIQNAIDALYYSKKKELKIKTYSNDEMVFLEISDSGNGINENILAQIYEPFFTTKKTNTSSNEPTGVGLGLYHAYSLLSPYNISFSHENTENGSTFTWNIPLKDLLSDNDQITSN